MSSHRSQRRKPPTKTPGVTPIKSPESTVSNQTPIARTESPASPLLPKHEKSISASSKAEKPHGSDNNGKTPVHGDIDNIKARKELGREIKSQVVFGMITTLILLILVSLIGHTSLGEEVNKYGYDVVQRSFQSSIQENTDNPVTIVDISDMPIVASSITSAPSARGTSRAMLAKVIDRLHTDGAKAIGIDVDFSPFPDSVTGYALPEDSVFFDHCLQVAQTMKVYLGVGRAVGETPALWLGSDAYKSLAAGIDVPKETVAQLVSWTSSENSSEPLPAMGEQLSKQVSNLPQGAGKRRRLLDWLEHARLIETSAPNHSYPNLMESFYVDYHPLKHWTAAMNQLDFAHPSASAYGIYGYSDILANRIPASTFAGKVVLLGNVRSPQRDAFQVPGFDVLVPGVLLHACACLTIARLPLYEMTSTGRWILDFTLALLLIGGSGSLRYYILVRRHANAEGERIEQILRASLAIIVVLIATEFTAQSRLMWDDFVYVIVGMYVHPWLHHHVHERYKIWRKQKESESQKNEKVE